MQKYDVHTHLLPNIDDGAQTPEETELLLNKLKHQGVNNIALTPHFYTDKQSVEDFVKNRTEAYNNLNLKDIQNINLVLGAEVFITDYIFNAKNLKIICYEYTNYMLTELPYNCKFDEKTFSKIDVLMSKYGVVPVLAHIERYPILLNNFKLIEKLKNIGCKTQINLSSLTHFQIRHKLFKLMKKDLIDLLGTDVHSESNRLNYNVGYNRIVEKFGQEYGELLQKNAKKMFNTEKINKKN